MSDNPIEHRFSRHQTISNTGVLLFKLMEACSSFMEWEVYGTSYKHGLDNPSIREEKRVGFAAMALELFQEIGLTKGELEQAWQEAQQNRKELEQISRESRGGHS